MTDPKIRYDILANAEGEEDVARLTRELEKLDDAIDPQAAARAKQLAAELDALGAKRTAVRQFLEALGNADSASRGLEAAQAALSRLERQLQSVEQPTRAQAGQLQKLRDVAAQAQTTFTQNTEALNRARGALDQYGLSANNLAGAEERLSASIRETAGEARILAGRYQETAQAARASAATQAAAQRQVADAVSEVGRQLRTVQNIAAAALGGSIVGNQLGDLARASDEYANLAARIKLVAGEGEAAQQALQGVIDIATRTGGSLEQTGALFTRIAQAGKEINLSQQDALDLTETINKAVAVSGASVQASEAAITQLVQGLQSGVLRGEEFNSVLEQAPRIAQALAAALGVTIGELRKLAEQGALTSTTVLDALQGQRAQIDREFAQLPLTVGRALQNLNTQWTAFIGQTSQATGASATAAKAITLLADNLEEVAAALLTVGQAWAAYKALDIAGALLRQALAVQTTTTATAAQTAATAGNTAAKAANVAATNQAAAAAAAQAAATAAATRAKLADTAATAANTAANAASASTLGNLARFIPGIGLAATAVALFGDLAAKAFSSAGTWIGEAAAKLAGYRDRGDEVLQQQRALEDGARKQRAAQAELDQQLKRSAEAAEQLSTESRRVVSEFEALQRKGESTAEALAKVAKSLDLSNVKGVETAIAALDVLAARGKITGEQLSKALGDALKGADLAAFETRARAAFDGSELGARRLKAAIDAIADESLRRAGTSAEELATGFSAASTSAINDVDKLAQTLAALGKTGSETSGLLAGALDKAIAASNTERAVRAVIDRVQELGRQGRIAGDDLTGALDKAQKKLDELRPGVDSLSEALRAFGIKTRAELEATAQRLGAAYRLLANDVTVSLQDKVKAFNQYREAAIAANGGVETSELALQRRILENKAAAEGLGKAIVETMGQAKGAVDTTGKAFEGLSENLVKFERDLARLRNGPVLGGIGPSQDGVNFGVRSAGGEANKVNGLTPIDSFGALIRGTPSGGITRSTSVQFSPPDDSGDWVFDYEAYQRAAASPRSRLFTPNPRDFWRKPSSGLITGGAFGRQPTVPGGFVQDPTYRPAPAPAPVPAPAPTSPPVSGLQPIVIQVGGQRVPAYVNNRSEADRLVDALERALQLSGGS